MGILYDEKNLKYCDNCVEMLMDCKCPRKLRKRNALFLRKRTRKDRSGAKGWRR